MRMHVWVCVPLGATLVTAIITWPSSPAHAQMYGRGPICWEGTPCPGYDAPVRKRVSRARPKVRQTKAKPPRQVKRPPKRIETATVKPNETRFYRYPSMYRAEAPPLMPPGANNFPPFSQQPYVLVSQGIWYWPGANDFKMPMLPGFEPVIDPSRVISW